MDDKDQRVIDSINAAIQKQIKQSWAAGLPITVGRNGKIIKIYPDGTEEVVKDTGKPPVYVEHAEYKI
jgi:hypothetical protein